MLASYTIGFLLGFWGSLHCVGMCGGVVGILQNALPKNSKQSYRQQLFFWLAYNGGRILSYSIAGGLAAWLGASVLQWVSAEQAHRIGQLISGLFLIAFGAYLANWWVGLQNLERFGAKFWRYISPLTQKVIPVARVHQAVLLGIVWGWLPCGLVYSALALSFTQPTVTQGLLLMLFFGLGTLPMLMLMAGMSVKVAAFAKHKVTRNILGIVIIAIGVLTFLGLMPGHGSHHNHHGHDGHMKSTGQQSKNAVSASEVQQLNLNANHQGHSGHQ